MKKDVDVNGCSSSGHVNTSNNVQDWTDVEGETSSPCTSGRDCGTSEVTLGRRGLGPGPCPDTNDGVRK